MELKVQVHLEGPGTRQSRGIEYVIEAIMTFGSQFGMN